MARAVDSGMLIAASSLARTAESRSLTCRRSSLMVCLRSLLSINSTMTNMSNAAASAADFGLGIRGVLTGTIARWNLHCLGVVSWGEFKFDQVTVAYNIRD